MEILEFFLSVSHITNTIDTQISASASIEIRLKHRNTIISPKTVMAIITRKLRIPTALLALAEQQEK
jgi:hypothetical protein